MKNVITLLDDPPFSEDQIPEVPKAPYLIAKGGEKQYELDPICKFADNKPIILIEREAEPGERLRDVEFRYRLDTSENIAFRMKIRQAAEASNEIKQVQLDLCRSSILYFCNAWCWTFVPNVGPVPFILYDFQEDILTWALWLIKTHQSGLVEKSRKQGLTWLMRILHGYMMLVNEHTFNYSLSMTEEDVDNRSEDSIMGKQRFLFKHLPEWMRFGWKERVNGIDNIMMMRFPERNNLIAGLLTEGTGGRSKRGVFADYDEYAHVKSARESAEASSSLSDSELYVSTVKGMGNPFAIIAHNPNTLKKSIHWTANPTLNWQWATKERSRPKYFTQEIWDQEMEIAYETSTSGRVFPQLRSNVPQDQERETWCHLQSGKYFEYDPAYEVYVGMDYGISDPNTVVFGQLKATPKHFTNKANNIFVIFDEHSARDESFESLIEYLKSMPYRYKLFVGDMFTADQRVQTTGEVKKDFFKKRGINLVGKRNTQMAPVEVVRHRMEMPAGFAVNKDKCPQLVKALQNWSFPTDGEGLPIPGSKPDHSQFSHLCKALCYLMDFMFGSPLPKKRKRRNWRTNLVRRASL